MPSTLSDRAREAHKNHLAAIEAARLQEEERQRQERAERYEELQNQTIGFAAQVFEIELDSIQLYTHDVAVSFLPDKRTGAAKDATKPVAEFWFEGRHFICAFQENGPTHLGFPRGARHSPSQLFLVSMDEESTKAFSGLASLGALFAAEVENDTQTQEEVRS